MTGCCQACSRHMFGEDREDFAGMIGRILVDEGYGLLVDCESCGPALVDIDGRRIDPILCDA